MCRYMIEVQVVIILSASIECNNNNYNFFFLYRWTLLLFYLLLESFTFLCTFISCVKVASINILKIPRQLRQGEGWGEEQVSPTQPHARTRGPTSDVIALPSAHMCPLQEGYTCPTYRPATSWVSTSVRVVCVSAFVSGYSTWWGCDGGWWVLAQWWWWWWQREEN